MKKSIFVLFICILNYQSYSQNYNIFPSQREVTYSNLEQGDIFIKLLFSSATAGDSTFYFNRFVDTATTGLVDCLYKTNDTSQLGLKYIKQNDGTELLFNKNGDTIYFKKTDTLLQEWIMYTFDNGDFIKARYLFALYGTIIPGTPIEDSLKRIHMEIFDALGNHIEDSRWWGEQFDITKNHGLSRFWNMNDFPEETDTIIIRLAGNNLPDEGITEINAYDAFNFQLGNEFHYREESVPDNESDADRRISAWKFYVMDTMETASSATYKMERIRFDTLYYGATPTSMVVWDTIDVTYNYSDYGFLDTLELNLFEATHFGYSDWVKNDTIFKGIAHKYVYDWFNYDAGTNCLSNPGEISQPEQLYGDGLGMMHYLDSANAGSYYKFDMVYFQKGLLQWGIPYDFSNLDVAIINSNPAEELNIFPNPALDVLNIQNNIPNGDYQISIYSVEGKLMSQFYALANNNYLEINIADLHAGCYLINLSNSFISYFGKFIKI